MGRCFAASNVTNSFVPSQSEALQAALIKGPWRMWRNSCVPNVTWKLYRYVSFHCTISFWLKNVFQYFVRTYSGAVYPKNLKPLIAICLTLELPSEDLLWSYVSNFLGLEYSAAPENVSIVLVAPDVLQIIPQNAAMSKGSPYEDQRAKDGRRPIVYGKVWHTPRCTGDRFQLFRLLHRRCSDTP